MIDCLYEPFKKWSENGSVFIISDTHFDDSDCKLMDNNWISPKEQVDIINKLAHRNDTLIILGDIGNVDWIRKLKAGHKVLIMGNHDSGATNYLRRVEKGLADSKGDSAEEANKSLLNSLSGTHKGWSIKTRCMYKHNISSEYVFMYEADNKLFDEVYEGPLFISEKIFLSHEPYNLPFASNIHGHDHAGKFRDGNNLNVAANVCKYVPINLASEIKGGLISKIPTIHRICIDSASKNPLHKKSKN